MNQPDAETAPNYVTCRCQYCNGGIEFDASESFAARQRFCTCQWQWENHAGGCGSSFVVEKDSKLQINEDWLHWSYISLAAIPGEGCKLVFPPINLPQQSRYTFLQVIITASAKQTKLQENSVVLQLK